MDSLKRSVLLTRHGLNLFHLAKLWKHFVVYIGMNVCPCTLHSKVRINYLLLNRSIVIKMSTPENKLYKCFERPHWNELWNENTWGKPRKCRLRARTTFLFPRFCSFFLFVSFLYTHGNGNSSSFRYVQRKLPRLSSLEHDVDFA